MRCVLHQGEIPREEQNTNPRDGSPIALFGNPHWRLPDFVLTALDEALPFWNGKGKTTSAIGVWERTFKRLFEIAEIPDGHAHRLRDTFAVDLLQRGVSLEDVSVVLGHSSIRITEKHYAPWVKSRQELLEVAVKKVWSRAFEDLV